MNKENYERTYILMGSDHNYEIQLGNSDKSAINTLECILDSVINTFFSYLGMDEEEIINNIKSDCGLSDDEIKEVD